MNPLRTLPRFFGLLALLIMAGIGITLATIAYLSDRAPSRWDTLIVAFPDLLFFMVYIILISLIASFTISLLSTIVRTSVASIAKTSIVFGSAIITAFLAWDEVNYLFRQAGSSLAGMMQGSIALMSNNITRISYAYCEASSQYCLQRNLYDNLNGVVEVFVEPATQFYYSVFQNPQFLVVIFVTFALSYFVFTTLLTAKMLDRIKHIRFSGTYTMRYSKNLLFFVMVLVAGYISLASIVVLPVSQRGRGSRQCFA